MPLIHYDNQSELDIYAQFDDDDGIVLPYSEGEGVLLRRYIITDTEIAAAELPPGSYHPSIRIGDVDDPQDSDQIIGAVDFYWNGATENRTPTGTPQAMGVEPVPANRTFVLVDGRNGFRSEDQMILQSGVSARTYAVDFRNDVSSNQCVYTIDSWEITLGPFNDGVSISAVNDWRTHDTQGRFQLAGVKPGEYEVGISVTYINPGTPGYGILRIKVL